MVAIKKNSKTEIPNKCKTACLKAIQRLATNEQNYTRTFIKLTQEQKDSAIRLSNMSKDKNLAEHVKQAKIIMASKFSDLKNLRDTNQTERIQKCILVNI